MPNWVVPNSTIQNSINQVLFVGILREIILKNKNIQNNVGVTLMGTKYEKQGWDMVRTCEEEIHG